MTITNTETMNVTITTDNGDKRRGEWRRTIPELITKLDDGSWLDIHQHGHVILIRSLDILTIEVDPQPSNNPPAIP